MKSHQKLDIEFPNEEPELKVEFADNPEPRVFCVILADTSGSMKGASIAQLNSGIARIRDHFSTDPVACSRVEIALVTFNDCVNVVLDFTAPDRFSPPALKAQGRTCMGAAVLKGLEMIESRLAVCKTNGVPVYLPWLVILSDGEPTDSIKDAAQAARAADARKRTAVFPLAVNGANTGKLSELSNRVPVNLDAANFSEFFNWLSVNLSSVSMSRPGEQVPLTPTSGWNIV